MRDIENWIKIKDIFEGIFKISLIILFIGTKVENENLSLGEQTTKEVVVCSITLFLQYFSIFKFVFFYSLS